MHKSTELRSFQSIDQQMNVVGGDAVIQDGQIELAQALTKGQTISVTVTRKLQKECPVVTPMGHVKDPTIDS